MTSYMWYGIGCGMLWVGLTSRLSVSRGVTPTGRASGDRSARERHANERDAVWRHAIERDA